MRVSNSYWLKGAQVRVSDANGRYPPVSQAYLQLPHLVPVDPKVKATLTPELGCKIPVGGPCCSLLDAAAGTQVKVFTYTDV